MILPTLQMAINSFIVPGNAGMLMLKQLHILLQCADPFAAWTGPVCAASLPTASVSLTHQAAQFSKLCWRGWQQCNLLVALGGSACLLRCLADCLLVHSTGNNAPIHLQSPAEACARQCKLPKGVVYVWLVASYSGCDSNGSHAGNTACTVLVSCRSAVSSTSGNMAMRPATVVWPSALPRQTTCGIE